MTAKMNPINHGSKLTPEQNLTKKIYEVMQLPYLSERHDAIKSLIEAEVEKAVEFTINNIESISYLPSGKTYQFEFGGREDLLTSATNRIMEQLQALRQKEN
jgi:hypothetical protein